MSKNSLVLLEINDIKVVDHFAAVALFLQFDVRTWEEESHVHDQLQRGFVQILETGLVPAQNGSRVSVVVAGQSLRVLLQRPFDMQAEVLSDKVILNKAKSS
jgi:hypothetical protein